MSQRFRNRAYLWTDRFISLQTMHQGFWLGVLDQEGLQRAGAESYRTWQRLYRDPDYNRAGLWPWEATAIERFFGGCESILIGAAGANVIEGRDGLRPDRWQERK